MTFLFSVTLFTSALLLFWVQPLLARLLLPMLGGTPAVWNGCMVFFQTVLLAGYLWAHLSLRRLGLRRQPWVQVALIALGAIALPVAVAGGEPPADGDPIPWLMATLALSVGLPAFVLSGTAPLLQRWFSSGRPEGRDPYFLYAASNAGSLAALLAYPLLLEPNVTLRGQATAWSAGYLVLLVLVAACAFAASRRGGASKDVAREPAPPLPWIRPARWTILALVPSSLLLGATTHLSTNIAAVPLFWVVPLALYLATFILTFSRRALLPHRLMVDLQPPIVLGAIAAVLVDLQSPALSFPLHLAALLVTGMVCHGELAADRPSAEHLTSFYLWISVGGVLGGMLTTFVAPAVFDSVAEYPLLLAAAFLLRPRPGRRPFLQGILARGVPLAPGAALAAALFTPVGNLLGIDAATTALKVAIAVALAACLLFVRRPASLGLAAVAVAVISLTGAGGNKGIIFVERNAYGVMKVRETVHDLNVLISGNTVHGAQATVTTLRREPLTYYRRSGPLGELMGARGRRLEGKAIAVVGLGAGTMAAYGESGQRYDFYEINPAVERLARDPRCFTYLADSKATVRVILGDGRLQLAKAPDRSYALIMLDAFSSDAIPVHLLTREAFDTYLAKLEPGGAIIFHITNRHLDLLPVVADLAGDRGMPCLYKEAAHSAESTDYGSGTTWAAVVRTLRDAGAIYDYEGWRWLDDPPRRRVWTDDYVDLIGALRTG